ncbi:TPA: hypothetical protein H1009_03280 [archaeon]|nr:hypothetical protein [Candidatus Naiadarchaeales archaeon SRR2090153.bin461]
MRTSWFVVGGLLLVVFIAGCTQAKEVKSDIENFETPYLTDSGNPLDSPTSRCITMCRDEKAKDLNFSSGPCLSNQISTDWVCDVAHDPREDIDNKPENQCSAYANGSARHFVEVDTNCNLIRTR